MEVTEAILRDIDVLDDEDLLELLSASVSGNVALIAQMLVNDLPVESPHPPQMAVEYALRLAQRGVAGNNLVRAYTIGKDKFVNILMIAAVLVPMVIGPFIGAVISGAAETYVELGVVKTVPTPWIFPAAAVVGALTVLPLLALRRMHAGAEDPGTLPVAAEEAAR